MPFAFKVFSIMHRKMRYIIRGCKEHIFKVAFLQDKFINEDEGFVQEERKRTI